jgi:hypothetical protein
MDLCRSCWSAPRWLRLVPVRVVFLVVLALAVLRGRDWSGRSYGALVRPLSSRGPGAAAERSYGALHNPMQEARGTDPGPGSRDVLRHTAVSRAQRTASLPRSARLCRLTGREMSSSHRHFGVRTGDWESCKVAFGLMTNVHLEEGENNVGP